MDAASSEDMEIDFAVGDLNEEEMIVDSSSSGSEYITSSSESDVVMVSDEEFESSSDDDDEALSENEDNSDVSGYEADDGGVGGEESSSDEESSNDEEVEDDEVDVQHELLGAYMAGVLDDEDFVNLFVVANGIRNARNDRVLQRWAPFDFNSWSEEECRVDTRFKKVDIVRLVEAFGLGDQIITYNRVRCSSRSVVFVVAASSISVQVC